jgi:hypothetical protein
MERMFTFLVVSTIINSTRRYPHFDTIARDIAEDLGMHAAVASGYAAKATTKAG